MTQREARRLALLVIWQEISGSLDTSDEWLRDPETDRAFAQDEVLAVREAGAAWLRRFEARLPKNQGAAVKHQKTVDRAEPARVCPICDRLIAEGLDEWDDSPDLLCFGETDPLCVPSAKTKVQP